MSASFSTSSIGGRCGSSVLICSTSRLTDSVIAALLALALRQTRQRVNLPCPFSYRFRGRAAIILPAVQDEAGAGPGARAHPCAAAHAGVIAQSHLPRQH